MVIRENSEVYVHGWVLKFLEKKSLHGWRSVPVYICMSVCVCVCVCVCVFVGTDDSAA